MHNLFSKTFKRILRAFCCVVNDQTIGEQENRQRNQTKTDCKLVLRFYGVEATPSDEEREDEHQEIKQNQFHEFDNSFT
jgi:hypothetical protein